MSPSTNAITAFLQINRAIGIRFLPPSLSMSNHVEERRMAWMSLEAVQGIGGKWSIAIEDSCVIHLWHSHRGAYVELVNVYADSGLLIGNLGGSIIIWLVNYRRPWSCLCADMGRWQIREKKNVVRKCDYSCIGPEECGMGCMECGKRRVIMAI